MLQLKVALTLVALVGFGFVYFYYARPYLKTLPTFSDAYTKEATIWAAIVTYLEGRKTIFTGIWGEIIAMGPDLLQILAGVDLKTALHLPDAWAAIVGGLIVPVLMLVFRTKVASQNKSS